MRGEIRQFGKYFRWMWQFWRRHKLYMTFLLMFTVFVIAIKTAFPVLLKYIIDKLSGDFAPSEAYQMIAIFVGAAVINEFVFRALPLTRAFMNNTIAAEIRDRFFQIYTRMPLSFFKRFRTGDLLTRLTDDIDGSWDRLGWYICSGVLRPIEAILVLSFTLGVMFHYSFWLTLFTFIPLPFLVLIMAKTEHKMVQYTEVKQKSISDCNNVLDACFSGIKVIKTTNSEEDQKGKYRQVIGERIRKEKDFLKINQIIHFFSMLVNHAGEIIVVLVGSQFVAQEIITLGTFLMFIIYLQRMIDPIWTLSWFYASSKQVFKYIDRLDETEGAFPPIKEGGEHRDIGDFDGLKFENVSFRFPDGEDDVLRDISFSIAPGEKVAIVGRVGSGKTTLLELVQRNLDPTSGDITLNGLPARDIHPGEISSLIGYVRQESVLFSETIRGNLLLGDSFTEREMENALSTAKMIEEIATFPEGMDTKLGQKGLSLSGGQKQRLSIARTLLRKPLLLLLDDCTAAMDADTEKMFWDNLMDDSPAVLVVTHRLATAKVADRILVLEGGRIAEEGSFEELLEKDDLFAKIIMTQET